MGQPVDPPVRPKTGRVTIFDPFIDGGSVQSSLTRFWRAELARFDT